MKRNGLNSRYLIVILALFFLVSGLQGQEIESKRVLFEQGENGTTIEGSLKGRQTIDYILNAKEGQVLNVAMATDNTANYFNIMEPKEDYVAIFNSAMAENGYEVELKKSGDYKIRVYLYRNAARRDEKANYQLKIQVTNSVPKTTDQDVLVKGTTYNATGQVPCKMIEGQAMGNCNFGVVRRGEGSGMVTITKDDGKTRTIFFENGKSTGYDSSLAKPEEFSSTKEFDTYLIKIGEERYEIPEAVIYGG